MPPPRRSNPADAAALARDLHLRPGVGAAAHVLQGRGLAILRSRVEQPALIVVDRGVKTVRPERGGAVQAAPSQALVLAGNQCVDFSNAVPEGAHCYEARWLLFDAALLDDPYYRDRAAQVVPSNPPPPSAHRVARVGPGLADAFERARQALAPAAGIADAVARQRLLEVMHWLLEEGIALHCAAVPPNVSVRLRALVAAQPGGDCSSEGLAGGLAMSEATLRRRLAAEGTSLSELVVDARMSMALTLLQATGRPVSDIALAVGYASPSRFAVRFRQRFGFAPTAVRGHARDGGVPRRAGLGAARHRLAAIPADDSPGASGMDHQPAPVRGFPAPSLRNQEDPFR